MKLDLLELSIIKTILDNPSLLNVVKAELEPDMFETHANEYNILLQDINDPSLHGLMLNEHIISYTKEELDSQLKILLVPYYKKKLQQLKFDETIDFKIKARKTIEFKHKLIELNSKKLIAV